MTISALAVSMVLAAGLNDTLETFPIGFWNYAPIRVFDEAKVQEWADAGMTLTMGPEYEATPDNIALMKRILEWSEARGIKVIVCDPRARARVPMPDGFKAQVEAAASDFGGYRSTFGLHVLDEPDHEQFGPMCAAARGVQAAGVTPFVNLLPWHDGINPRIGYDDFQRYLDDFVKQSGVRFLCYDCYSQMNPNKAGWPMYFRNLREYGEAAKRNGIPFWTTILSVGHFHYKPPTEDDIRWQFNSAVAYGAQGILYFFFYMRQPHDNYRLAPVDEFWDRTPIFDSLKRTNKGFIKRYGRLFLDLELQKAAQYPEPVEGCVKFEPDDLIAALNADGNRPLIVSRFADKQGRPWVALVNNSTEESTLVRIAFKGEKTVVFQRDWNGNEIAGQHQKKAELPDTVLMEHWLAPGQMEVYRVQPAG